MRRVDVKGFFDERSERSQAFDENVHGVLYFLFDAAHPHLWGRI